MKHFASLSCEKFRQGCENTGELTKTRVREGVLVKDIKVRLAVSQGGDKENETPCTTLRGSADICIGLF